VPDGSVSSHHCEILLRGSDVVVKDLNSTNGTFVNGQQITGEAPLKPGQILRLGQIEMRLESGEAKAAPKKLPDQTMVIPQGVNMTEIQKGTKPVAFEKDSPFAKKTNRGTKLFVTMAIIIGLAIVAFIVYSIMQSDKLVEPK
jgi:hypothetical protein